MGTKGRINREARSTVPPTEPGHNKRQEGADEIESENALGSACSLHPHCGTQNTVHIVQVRKQECREAGGPTLLYTDRNKICLAQFPANPLHTSPSAFPPCSTPLTSGRNSMYSSSWKKNKKTRAVLQVVQLVLMSAVKTVASRIPMQYSEFGFCLSF